MLIRKHIKLSRDRDAGSFAEAIVLGTDNDSIALSAYTGSCSFMIHLDLEEALALAGMVEDAVHEAQAEQAKIAAEAGA